MGFYCIGFSIKLVKNQAWNEESVLFRNCLTRCLLAKKACEKYMLEVEVSWQAISLTSVSREGPTCEILAKHSTWRFLSVTFLPFTHTIYTLITHKCMRGYSERKTLDRFSTTQHTYLLERESYSSVVRNHSSLFSFLLPFSYLERRFVPKHNPHLFRV